MKTTGHCHDPRNCDNGIDVCYCSCEMCRDLKKDKRMIESDKIDFDLLDVSISEIIEK